MSYTTTYMMSYTILFTMSYTILFTMSFTTLFTSYIMSYFTIGNSINLTIVFIFWLLWTTFTSCCPLGRRFFCFRCVMVDPYFIYCRIPTQKILSTLLDSSTALWILDTLLFLVGCEQTRHSLRKKLTHPQRFVQNCKHTTFWYLQGVSYLTQLEFTIAQDYFVSKRAEKVALHACA